MQNVRIQVLIPAYNNENEIKRTLDSVWEQNYEKENIYITVVDFESKDDTVQRVFAYPNYHLGIYRKPEQKNVRHRVAEAARILDYVCPGGEYYFLVLLYPGDILYPDCFSKCAEAFVENYHKNPIMVICEADIIQPDGAVMKQKPLYPENKIIDGKTEFNDYIRKEYKHQIFEMVTFFGQNRYKSNGEMNEQRFWNKAARINHERNAVYIKEALVCTKAMYYEDEFEEILFRWEAIISIIRFHTSKFGHGINDDFELLAKKNLAEYALWRSWILYQKSGILKETEDCFLIAGVICSDIEASKIYDWMEKLILKKDDTVIHHVRSYFI